MQLRLELDDRLGALGRERRERRDRAGELHEDLCAERHIGVAVAGDHLLDGELTRHGELLRDRLRQPGLGTPGNADRVRGAAQESGEVGLEESGPGGEPGVAAAHRGDDLEELIQGALLGGLRERDRYRREPSDVVAVRENRERRRLAEDRARRVRRDLEARSHDAQDEHRGDRGLECLERLQDR